MNKLLQNELVIADTFRQGPAVTQMAASGRWQFSRWQHFVGSYDLPALPHPLFVVQLAGKSDVRFWDRDGWSKRTTFPGAATIVPAGMPTRWLVDGELDVVTFSAAKAGPHGLPREIFRSMRFAYTDPLALALSRQLLRELYESSEAANQSYTDCLAGTLTRHLLHQEIQHGKVDDITPESESFRVNRVIASMTSNPGSDHTLMQLARTAGITEEHLCRLFKKSAGVSPHQYLINIRMEKARRLLRDTNATIAEVAEHVGFKGASQFSRTFQKRFTEAPSDYRRRMAP